MRILDFTQLCVVMHWLFGLTEGMSLCPLPLWRLYIQPSLHCMKASGWFSAKAYTRGFRIGWLWSPGRYSPTFIGDRRWSCILSQRRHKANTSKPRISVNKLWTALKQRAFFSRITVGRDGFSQWLSKRLHSHSVWRPISSRVQPRHLCRFFA